MKSFSGTSAKTLTKFFTSHRNKPLAYLLTANFRVDGESSSRLLTLSVYKNTGPVPHDKDTVQGQPAQAAQFTLNANSGAERSKSGVIVLDQDDYLSFTVVRANGGSDPSVAPWEVDFRICRLSDEF